jgi:hypothetical protein
MKQIVKAHSLISPNGSFPFLLTMVCLLHLWGVVSCSATVVPVPNTAPAVVEESEFTEVLRLLRSQYADPGAVKDPAINRSALNGVLGQLGAGAMLLSQPSLDAGNVRKIQLQTLRGQAGYLRCASFVPTKDWAVIEKQLVAWESEGLAGVIIDVRDFGALNDYEGAARLASCFVPSGVSLFSIQGLQTAQKVFQNTKASPSFKGPVVVLTNRRTVGAGEAFAAAIRQYGTAVVLGRSTAGQAALYTETKLQTGRWLRLASAQVVLGNGTRLYGVPVSPDIGLFIDDAKEREALWQIEQGALDKVVAELPSRPKMNEKSLVAEENPEIERNSAENVVANNSGILQDAALIQALDVLLGVKLQVSRQ